MPTDLADLRRKLDQMVPGQEPRDLVPLIKELLSTTLPVFEVDLREMQKDHEAAPAPLAAQAATPPPFPALAILAGVQKYTKVLVPVLAIFAVPHDLGLANRNDPATRASF
jgi:non-heme chloroperoxidase